MSIHDFHSKLMSGKEEGRLIEGLRRMRGIGRGAMASEAEPGWAYWEESTTDGTVGWASWETSSEALSQA